MHRIAAGVPVTQVSFQMFSRLILSWQCTELRQPQDPRVFQSPMGLLPNALHLKEVSEVKQSCECESVCCKLQCPLSSPGSLLQQMLVCGVAPALPGDPHRVSLGLSPYCCAETLPAPSFTMRPAPFFFLMMVLNMSLGLFWSFFE